LYFFTKSFSKISLVQFPAKIFSNLFRYWKHLLNFCFSQNREEIDEQTKSIPVSTYLRNYECEIFLFNPGCNKSLGEEWSELEDCGAAQAQQEGRDAKVRGVGAVPQLPTCFKYWGNHLSFPFVFTD
jgi:hypothetical protein